MDPENISMTPRQDILNPSCVQGDELTLLDIWNILRAHRNVVIVTGLIFFMASLTAAILLPPSYRTRVVLLPPLVSDVELLNIPDFFAIKPDDMYGRFLRNLQSVSLQEDFLMARNLQRKLQGENQPLKNKHDVFRKIFSEQLVLTEFSMVTGKKNVFSFSLEGDNPDKIAKWLNDFVSYVDIHTVKDVISDIDVKVKARTAILKKRIKSLREIAMLRRLDQIAMLEEAAGIASRLKIDKQEGSVYTYKNEVTGRDEKLTSIKETPSYLRGSKALMAEAAVLKSRKNDDPFIPTLRNVQEELLFYKSISSPESIKVHAARIDQTAIADYDPVKPKKKLIVFLGSLSGVMIGLFIAFVKGIFSKDSTTS